MILSIQFQILLWIFSTLFLSWLYRWTFSQSIIFLLYCYFLTFTIQIVSVNYGSKFLNIAQFVPIPSRALLEFLDIVPPSVANNRCDIYSFYQRTHTHKRLTLMSDSYVLFSAESNLKAPEDKCSQNSFHQSFIKEFNLSLSLFCLHFQSSNIWFLILFLIPLIISLPIFYWNLFPKIIIGSSISIWQTYFSFMFLSILFWIFFYLFLIYYDLQMLNDEESIYEEFISIISIFPLILKDMKINYRRECDQFKKELQKILWAERKQTAE